MTFLVVVDVVDDVGGGGEVVVVVVAGSPVETMMVIVDPGVACLPAAGLVPITRPEATVVDD